MTDRRSPIVKTGRFLQRIPLQCLRPVETLFLRASSKRSTNPQIVILLALPRSGSTLTYQCLIHSVKPLYLSNLWNLLYALPWIGGTISGRRCAEHRSNFKSDQGFVEGLCGPAEGLRFWSYWLGCGLDEVNDTPLAQDLLARRVNYLRRTVANLSTPEKPFITGYLGHILAANKLRKWFPEAIFIRLHRDPLSNAASILRARQRNARDWFSVFPSECAQTLEESEYRQVASQVYWLNRRLNELNDKKIIHLAYEELCRNPRTEIQRVVEYCNESGMRLQCHQDLPKTFACTVANENTSPQIAKLSRLIRELEEQHGSIHY